jgi:uncharacterized iron-regulated protein
MEIKERIDISRNPKWVENIMNWIIYGDFEKWAERNKQKILEANKKNNE